MHIYIAYDDCDRQTSALVTEYAKDLRNTCFRGHTPTLGCASAESRARNYRLLYGARISPVPLCAKPLLPGPTTAAGPQQDQLGPGVNMAFSAPPTACLCTSTSHVPPPPARGRCRSAGGRIPFRVVQPRAASIALPLPLPVPATYTRTGSSSLRLSTSVRPAGTIDDPVQLAAQQMERVKLKRRLHARSRGRSLTVGVWQLRVATGTRRTGQAVRLA
jgi:hypothetical protein